MIRILCIVFLITLWITLITVSIRHEKRQYNECKCPRCNNNLRHFDTDSQGGRGYCCDNCHYHTWVSWKFVDKYKPCYEVYRLCDGRCPGTFGDDKSTEYLQYDCMGCKYFSSGEDDNNE